MMRPTNAAGKENEANIATGHVSTHLKEKNFVEMCNKITFVPVERSVHVKQKIIDGGKKGLNGTIFQKLGKENTNVTIEHKGNYNKSAGIRNQLHYEESENGNQNSIIKLPNEILSDSYADSGHHQRYENSVLFQESSTEEYHIIIPSNMRRERRSRNERSKSKTSRSGYDNPQSDNNASYCSVRNTSNDCSNQYSSDVLQNQNHNQTRVSTARAKTSHRARNNHLGYASKEKENIFSSYRSTKKDESLLLDSYRSLQERTVNKSCENDRYNFKELHDNQDPKIRSIYRMLNSLGKNRPDTYRERSENRKASKLGVNQSVCLSNRNNRSILGRESQQTQRRSTVDNLKAGYKDIANKSKLEKKELIFKRENGGIEIESKDSSTQRNWENKALKPTNLNKGLEGSGKNMVVAEETKVIISKERKIINNYHSAKENSKVAKFPNPKTTLESTYYEEFIRKKKLNEKLLQPRSRNSQSISQEKVLTKKSEMKRLENRQEIKKETKKPDQNKTIQSNYKRNMENKETLSVDNKLYDSEYDSAKTKKSTLMGVVNLNRHQNPNALSRLDRVVDKTIVEKTYVEKAQIKNKVYIGNPSINLSTNRSKRDNFESLIEEEQSQAENLTYRGEDWPSHPNSVRENSLWDKVAENYGIDIEEITREWEKLAENQLQSRRQNELENKDTVSGQVSDHMKAQEPKINYHLQKEEESSKAKEEEKTKVSESNETNLTWDIIRKIEDKAARKIQEFFVDRLQKIRNNKSLKLNKISYINLDDNKLLFEAYKDYENLYQKIADVIGDQIINKDKNDLAMAFVAAYSCLNSSYLSADEAQSLIQKVISSYE